VSSSRDLAPDPFDDPSMRDFGGPYASRPLRSDRWVATGGLGSGRGPRGPLPPGIRAAKLTMYLQSGLMVLLLTPLHDAGLTWAVPLMAAIGAVVLWAGASMMWGRPEVRRLAVALELSLIPVSLSLMLSGVTGAVVSLVVAVTASSMLLSRSAAELGEP
jgi:hypothetical protein